MTGSMALLALVLIVALVAGGIRYMVLRGNNMGDSDGGRRPGVGALRTFGLTLGLGLLLLSGYVGWVVYVMSPTA